MLENTRIPMGEGEKEAVDRLLAEHGSGSLSRRDPGEQGPLVVKIDGRQWVVLPDGSAKEVDRG